MIHSLPLSLLMSLHGVSIRDICCSYCCDFMPQLNAQFTHLHAANLIEFLDHLCYLLGWLEIDVVHTSVDTFCSVTLSYLICVFVCSIWWKIQPSNSSMKIQCNPFQKPSFNKGNYTYFMDKIHHFFPRPADELHPI